MRLVTILTENYIPGFRALVNSLERNGGLADIRFSVVCLDKFVPPIAGFDYFQVGDLGRFDFDRSLLCKAPRFSVCLEKPLVWLLPHQEPCLYLDSDILCLNPLDRLDEYDELSAVVNQSQIGKRIGYEPTYRTSLPVWNAGVFVFRPNRATFEGIQEHARTYTDKISHSDQNILNGYFSGVGVNWMDLSWNTGIVVNFWHPSLFDLNQIKLLHYAWDEKPWLHPARREWQADFWSLWELYR